MSRTDTDVRSRISLLGAVLVVLLFFGLPVAVGLSLNKTNIPASAQDWGGNFQTTGVLSYEKSMYYQGQAFWIRDDNGNKFLFDFYRYGRTDFARPWIGKRVFAKGYLVRSRGIKVISLTQLNEASN